MSIEETLGRIADALEKIAKSPRYSDIVYTSGTTMVAVDAETEVIIDPLPEPNTTHHNSEPEAAPEKKKVVKKKKAKAKKKEEPKPEPLKEMEAVTGEAVSDQPVATLDELEEITRRWVTKLNNDKEAVDLFAEFGEKSLKNLKEENISPMYYAIKERLGE